MRCGQDRRAMVTEDSVKSAGKCCFHCKQRAAELIDIGGQALIEVENRERAKREYAIRKGRAARVTPYATVDNS
jgi:hypothetical protein